MCVWYACVHACVRACACVCGCVYMCLYVGHVCVQGREVCPNGIKSVQFEMGV